MKISSVTCTDIKSWGHIEIDDDDNDIEFIIMPSAKARLCDYTGLTEAELDERESLTMAYLALCVFLYDNRSLSIVNDKQNAVIESFLDAHRMNLL